MEKRMMVNGSNAVPGHRAPADGTARLSGSTQQPAHANGAGRDQAPAFGPRTGVAVLAIAITVSPKWAVLMLPLPLLAVTLRRTRLMALAGTAIIALGGAAMVAGVLLRHFPADFGWPTHFERLHRPMLAGAVLVAVAAILAPGERTADDADR